MIPLLEVAGLTRGTIMLAMIIGLSFTGCTVKVEPIKVEPITVNTQEKTTSTPVAAGSKPMAGMEKPCPDEEVKCSLANKDECEPPKGCQPRPLPPGGIQIGGVQCTWGNQCGNPGASCSGGTCKNTLIGNGGCMCACRP